MGGSQKTYEENKNQKASDMLENQQSNRSDDMKINSKKDIYWVQLTLNWL